MDCDVCSVLPATGAAEALTLSFGSRQPVASPAGAMGVQLQHQCTLERGMALQLHGALLQLLQAGEAATGAAPGAP